MKSGAYLFCIDTVSTDSHIKLIKSRIPATTGRKLLRYGSISVRLSLVTTSFKCQTWTQITLTSVYRVAL